jgi:hypothetical protein
MIGRKNTRRKTAYKSSAAVKKCLTLASSRLSSYEAAGSLGGETEMAGEVGPGWRGGGRARRGIGSGGGEASASFPLRKHCANIAQT